MAVLLPHRPEKECGSSASVGGREVQLSTATTVAVALSEDRLRSTTGKRILTLTGAAVIEHSRAPFDAISFSDSISTSKLDFGPQRNSESERRISRGILIRFLCKRRTAVRMHRRHGAHFSLPFVNRIVTRLCSASFLRLGSDHSCP